jgi:hypothetical protein
MLTHVVEVPRTGVYVQTYPRILQKVDPQQSVIVGGFWQTMNVVAITRSASPTLTRATRTFSHLPDPSANLIVMVSFVNT